MDEWEQVAGPLLHPDDTHLIDRSKILHGGHLMRHRQTGVYRLSTGGVSLRSVPQDWAREVHAAVPVGVGPRIAAARQRAGLSQVALAELVGHTQSEVSLWETGKREPGVSSLVRLADALEVTVDALLREPG